VAANVAARELNAGAIFPTWYSIRQRRATSASPNVAAISADPNQDAGRAEGAIGTAGMPASPRFADRALHER